MARIARKNLDNTFFHVMVQGNNREFIFPDDICKQKYLGLIKNAKTKDDIVIYAYCVMGNHAHILLSGASIESISSFMRRINTEYGRWFNIKTDRVGYVFRDRFKSESIISENYLGKCLAYIHANPLKAQLVDNLDDYKFSSFHEFVTQVENIIEFDKVAELFDISPSNIRDISNKTSDNVFMDIDDIEKEDFAEVLQELLTRYNISDTKRFKYDTGTFSVILKELKKRTKVSNKYLGDIFNTNRNNISSLLL